MPDTSDHKDTYTRLIELLDQHGAQYRLIDHPEEGRCEVVSPMRGHDVSHAAKCMIWMVKIGKKTKKFVLAVVPGDMKVSQSAVRGLFGGTYAGLAPDDDAERLAQSVKGTVLPFRFSEELNLVVDPLLKDHEFIYFNAARLDRSVELRTEDYLRIANPRFERIAER